MQRLWTLELTLVLMLIGSARGGTRSWGSESRGNMVYVIRIGALTVRCFGMLAQKAAWLEGVVDLHQRQIGRRSL